MFTGIVEEIGTIKNIQKGKHSAVLIIQAKTVLEDLKVGDSIAVNGICFTAISFDSNSFSADVMHETLNRSSLAQLKRGSYVNLERAMPVNGRFGGHIVAGHVDGVGKIIKIEKDDTAIWYTIKAESSILRYIIQKGSIAVDGVSLTVAQVSSDWFSVSTIPHTNAKTILSKYKVGDIVNLENDMIGKYVEKLLKNEQSKSNLTKEFLLQCGF